MNGRAAATRDRLVPVMPFVIPLLLAPLTLGWLLKIESPMDFGAYRADILFGYLVYIVLVRFALLDLMLFYVARKRRSLRLDVLQIVVLYLEVSIVTLVYFAALYDLFGVFGLFVYNGTGAVRHMLTMEPHGFGVALYISMELFATLGLGDWAPRTLNAMFAAGIEALLGFVQGGVFFCGADLYASGQRPGRRIACISARHACRCLAVRQTAQFR
jgi:hypothetical protein